MDAYLDELGRRSPGTGELIERITALRSSAAREREPFFEHRSLLVLDDGKPRLAGVVAADFNAWRHHMADGSSVRMRALEVGTAAELAAGRMISAMATARAHMEVAGLAAYCCRALYNCGRSGDFAPVEKLIVQTYFGSNMRIQVKGTPALEPHLRPEEVRPFRIGDLIKAMDEFRASGEEPGTLCQLTYGLLSEYAHPVMRATSASFTDVLSENEDGWEIRYHEENRLDEGEARMALEILLDNMRIGHASAALLHRADVVGGGGPLRLRTPSPPEVHDIYANLLQQPDD
jgi:hypothetical protein